MNLTRMIQWIPALALVALAACGGSDTPAPTPVADPTKAAATVGAAGGTVATGNGLASAVFPANAFAADTAVTIAPSSTAPASTRLVTGTAYDFGPPGALAQPANLSLQ